MLDDTYSTRVANDEIDVIGKVRQKSKSMTALERVVNLFNK